LPIIVNGPLLRLRNSIRPMMSFVVTGIRRQGRCCTWWRHFRKRKCAPKSPWRRESE